MTTRITILTGQTQALIRKPHFQSWKLQHSRFQHIQHPPNSTLNSTSNIHHSSTITAKSIFISWIDRITLGLITFPLACSRSHWVVGWMGLSSHGTRIQYSLLRRDIGRYLGEDTDRCLSYQIPSTDHSVEPNIAINQPFLSTTSQQLPKACSNTQYNNNSINFRNHPWRPCLTATHFQTREFFSKYILE